MRGTRGTQSGPHSAGPNASVERARGIKPSARPSAWQAAGTVAPDLIDNEGFEGRPAIRRALATLGTIEGYAVGGCCDLSTSTHHLVQRLGMEQGYNLAKDSGRDLEEAIACATAGLRRRFAARVWRDYYKHVDARRQV